jgi:hypothetical protein
MGGKLDKLPQLIARKVELTSLVPVAVKEGRRETGERGILYVKTAIGNVL